jgi:hypothetical protein
MGFGLASIKDVIYWNCHCITRRSQKSSWAAKFQSGNSGSPFGYLTILFQVDSFLKVRLEYIMFMNGVEFIMWLILALFPDVASAEKISKT